MVKNQEVDQKVVVMKNLEVVVVKNQEVVVVKNQSGMGSLLKSDAAAGGESIGLKGTGQVSVTHRTFIVET